MVKTWIWTLVLAVVGLALFLAGVFIGNQTTLGTSISIIGLTLIIISALARIWLRMKPSKDKVNV